MGLLDDLGKFGIKNLDASKLYDTPEKAVKKNDAQEAKPVEFNEEDYIFWKKFECPICDSPINTLIVKSGRARLIKMDKDLRPIYEGFEPIKYEPILCQCCGYSVMGRYFGPLTPSQKKAVMEGICTGYQGKPAENKPTIGYEEALNKITLALASAMVKRGKASEKAYICLKGGWLCRSFKESLDPNSEDYDIMVEELNKKEKEFLDNAYEGFVQARQSEGYPMGGMDETTLDYLLAALATERGEVDVASRMIASILQSPSAAARIKDKARDLKEEIVQMIKDKKVQG